MRVGSWWELRSPGRPSSPHFGNWVGASLTGEGHEQLYLPPGFAHGFCVTSETALFSYKCSEAYVPEAELVIRWDDPAIGITWPPAQRLVSARDAAAPRLRLVDPASLPE